METKPPRPQKGDGAESGPCLLWALLRPMSIVAKRLDGLRCHGTEVGLGPGDFVFDGDLALPEKRAQSKPNFWPMSIVVKRLDGSGRHLVRR